MIPNMTKRFRMSTASFLRPKLSYLLYGYYSIIFHCQKLYFIFISFIKKKTTDFYVIFGDFIDILKIY